MGFQGALASTYLQGPWMNLEAKDQNKRGGKLGTWSDSCLQMALKAYLHCQVQINLKLYSFTLREHKEQIWINQADI